MNAHLQSQLVYQMSVLSSSPKAFFLIKLKNYFSSTFGQKTW